MCVGVVFVEAKSKALLWSSGTYIGVCGVTKQVWVVRTELGVVLDVIIDQLAVYGRHCVRVNVKV